jgi:hypothetical protein
MSSASSISTSLAPYTTTTDVPKGLNIEINWDSSVATAPPQFMTDVEQVANFYASELKPISTGPIIIDVGYGEINGSKIGGSALGESETNLQQVSYLQLTNAYAGTGLINNFPSAAPSGKFYVSDAEAQALGIQLTNPPTVDGYIGFSSKSNTFDYNTNSINTTTGSVQPNEYDFEGTVAHEISEVLGRIFLGNNQISAYDFFHYSSGSNGPVHDFAPNGGFFSINGGTTDLGNFNAGRGGDGSDWATGGTSSPYDAFNAFGTPGQIAPVTPTDLAVLQALGYQLTNTAAKEAAAAVPVSPALTQTTVQNTVNSPPGNSSGLDQQVALFNQYMAAGFPEQHCGSITTNALSQVTTNEQQFLANPHHG